MQPVLDHLNRIVRPALRAYVAAEEALDAAHKSGDQAAIAAARDAVVGAGWSAATSLHHMSDVVLHNPPPGRTFAKIEDVRTAIRNVCTFARGQTAVTDTDLLHDAADALKHYKLNRKSDVAGAWAVVAAASGYGEMRYGEPKYGGKEQVIINTVNGHKYSLLWIMQNSYDAWMRVMGEPELPFGQYGPTPAA
jgi:hypothetical protein